MTGSRSSKDGEAFFIVTFESKSEVIPDPSLSHLLYCHTHCCV